MLQSQTTPIYIFSQDVHNIFMDDNQILVFPANFSFGSGTSAFQVEGNSDNRTTDWDEFLKENNNIIHPNEIGPEWWTEGNAEKDIEEIASLGLKIQRIGFEWARIEPEKEIINYNAVKRYKKIIKEITSQGMSPLVTLNHFTLPSWIAKEGGWECPRIATYFKKFTQLMVSEFPEVTHWITINEPNVLVSAGYLSTYFPPQKGSPRSAIKARHNMIIAHRRAYHVIKHANPNAKVGAAFAIRWDRAASAKDPFERIYTKLVNYLSELSYIDAMKSTSDFIGVNFYTGYFLNLNIFKINDFLILKNRGYTEKIFFGEYKTPDTIESDFNWPIVPDFLLNALHVLHKKYKLPILITENGIADENDTNRAFYILTHLVAVWRALHEGIPVAHYLHWATVDNIEWREGYSKKFGLIGIDTTTGKRSLRNSAQLYKEVASTGKIDVNHVIKTYIPQDLQEKAYKTVNKLLQGKLSRRIKNE